ncbi:MAG: SusC/RagA family TonB-linked outer membrane protein [Bacteroidales bacterium]|nr:SusC/RagA family TonB-linked outer membrane protein [Bacteroidales bacterium]
MKEHKYNFSKKLLLLILLMGIIAIVNAQKLTVTGIVTDEPGEPLPGVYVLVKGAVTGTATDKDGHYILKNVPPDAVLSFSYIGFETQEVAVNGQLQIDIHLREEVITLSEITINAGYYNVKERESTGSIVKIAAKEIENQPVSNVLSAVQGRMAGVYIAQNSGLPGSGLQIRIRGQNSLRSDGNDPLYIIDGVPYSSGAVGSSYTNSAISGDIDPLTSIDPSSIESIEVLKDADATAIYGSRGANGVVLITTRQGQKGKTLLNMDYSYGQGWVKTYLDLMKTPEYVKMREEAYANDGYTEYPVNAYDVNGTWDKNRYTNWEDVLIGGTSEINDIRGTISGGNDNTTYLISGSYHRETTVYPKTFVYNKAGVHTSLSHTSPNQRFTVHMSSGYTVQQNNLPATVVYASQIYKLPPNAPALYNEDGSLNWESSTWENPLASMESKYRSDSYDLVSNIQLSYELFKGFSLKNSMGYTSTKFMDLQTMPSTMYDPVWNATSEYSAVYKNNVYRESWITEPQLTYETELGDFRIKVLAGSTFQKLTSTQLVNQGYGFSSNSLIENLAAANEIYIYADNKTAYKYNAVFGRINFSYKERYILNLTGRRDGSSRFGPGRQFANFGAVGFAWLFSDEEFVKNAIPFLSFGKLRGSYGTSGSDQIGDYQYIDTYTVSGNTYGGVSVIEPSRLFNPIFGWETNKKLEFGLETGFFNARFYFTASWYRNRSSGQLVGIPLPGTTGFSSIQANLNATVENTGWELTFRSMNLQQRNFSWNTTFNISFPRNKLVSFPGLEGSTYANTYVVGKPLNIKKVYSYQGLDPETGLYTFKDYNDDGALTREDDREMTEDMNPEFFGGIQNSFKIGRFQLDFLFQLVRQQNYSFLYITGVPGTMANQPVCVTNHWQEPGDRVTYQPYTTGINTDVYNRYTNYQQSDAVIEDASYIRLKNISLTYSLPEAVLKNIRFSVFLRGQNLLTLTSYEGFDPESVYPNSLPPLRVITTGIQMSF